MVAFAAAQLAKICQNCALQRASSEADAIRYHWMQDLPDLIDTLKPQLKLMVAN
jgi:hypothetical protein